ncbi:myocardin-related transcription factor B isoform X2 [Pungitius pungitius]|uniref:myocardin-related transcription factor B isoform X2 n=1 Tax=Pungitius pungitius TaxID=134920 RepID=UPI002E0E8A5C
MGLQTWPPSRPLSSMACLDVETPSICRGKFKSALKTPAAFHEQIRSLERARTGSFLKHKLCSRPQRSELVRMHILQETQAVPSLQATQMKLKKARLTDDLNEKIAQRPGPMELVEKNILPVDSGVEDDVDGGEANGSKPADIFSFDEDSSDALSPRQPASQKYLSSTSQRASEATSTSSYLNSRMQHSPPTSAQSASSAVGLLPAGEQQSKQQASALQPISTAAPSVAPGPLLVKQSLPRLPSDKSRSKKSKEPKSRVKKLKYHQYIPPDQKQELHEVLMDSAYARLLQQQQQFLQLQILNQQQQQYSYQSALPAPLKPATEAQSSCSSVVLSGKAASRHTQTTRKPDRLPANLDEMKVAELKRELKLRSLPVSGTKLDLIERLKLYQENSNGQIAAADETAASQSDNRALTPPASPTAGQGVDDSRLADSPAELSEALSSTPSVTCANFPPRAPTEECAPETRSYERDSERDKRLHDKERQIEELMRKLEQEQRMVEELKIQLEVEKRSQQADPPARLAPFPPVRVKEESGAAPSCSASSVSPALPARVKQEDAVLQSRFIVGEQTFKPLKMSPPVPACRGASAASAPLPASRVQVHAAGLIQVPQEGEASAALQHQRGTEPLTKSPGCTRQPTAILPKVTDHLSKCKDPPRYEDAVKQTRGLQATVQRPTAASQQMDDLFDVLIESGEISPFIRQHPPSLEKPLPVTASVTVLPVNTASSRPPPVVQVARRLPAPPPPPPPLSPSGSLGALTSTSQLETLLGAHTQTLKLTEEVHPPAVSMEGYLNESRSPSALHSTNMDNMDWLDLTLSVPAEGVNALDMSAPVGVFSSDFLDSHELHLNWD